MDTLKEEWLKVENQLISPIPLDGTEQQLRDLKEYQRMLGIAFLRGAIAACAVLLQKFPSTAFPCASVTAQALLLLAEFEPPAEEVIDYDVH